MPHRRLRTIGTDFVGIVLERSGFLEPDGFLDEDGELTENTTAFTERLRERTYLVRVPENDQVPALHECAPIWRVAGQIFLENDGAAGGVSRAD
ncbi:hypothetical protein [Halobaculum magnesiiphilum]|uniref:DUF8053 domain-containing protein n=1 Tax=Halobaculum magnesiiphilum TaxID=1017351 RepID=A0A8T8WI27_9EURY|nr:hypothetical protein [Halobaculum magnesiiphilum]QZP39446.1 hypothetical protein K6T50_17845 [Halobaculum magnesiiphilum]